MHAYEILKQEAQRATYRAPEYNVPPLLTGRPSCFSNLPEKHKLDRGRCDLASCQVLFCSAISEEK